VAGKTETVPDEVGVRILVRLGGKEQHISTHQLSRLSRSAHCVQAFDSGEQASFRSQRPTKGATPRPAQGGLWGTRQVSSEDDVERHLHEALAADGVLDHAQAALGRKGMARVRVERGLNATLLLGGVKAGMVEPVAEMSLVAEREPLGQLGQFHDRKVEPGLRA